MTASRTPGWVWGICLGIGLIEPATHLWLKYGLPGDVVFSGLHIGDTVFFLHAMRMFQNDFFSAYVTCHYAAGPHGPTLFPLIHHWLYGLVGWLGAVVHADPFLFLGFVNGASGFFYLWSVYRFLRVAAREQARLAFLIFALGGGLGGVLFLVTGAAGLHGAAGFGIAFHRWARYELIEGPFLSPILLQPRLYYTLPLALGFLALTRYLRKGIRARLRDHVPGMIALFVAACINARLGPLFCFALACHLALQSKEPVARRAVLGLLYAVPVGAAVVLTLLGLGLNPTLAAGIPHVLTRSIWFGSLVSVIFWHLPAAVPAVKRAWAGLPVSGRVLAGACLGYLGAFALLYGAYQTYWGNWLGRGDATAALHVSDPALVGAIFGGVAGCRRASLSRPSIHLSWMLLWFLPLCAAGVSALGQGYLLRFMPERFMVLMPVPLAVLTAAGLQHWMRVRPRTGRFLLGVILVCGLCSAAVACLCFQGPVGFTPGRGPFQLFHTEAITPDEARVVDAIEEGVMLAPATIPLFGDIAVARRPGVRTVHGQGTLGFGDVDIAGMGGKVNTFFAPETPEGRRRDFVKSWCVDYIICPEAPPVAPETVAALKSYGWTSVALEAGNALLLKVNRND